MLHRLKGQKFTMEFAAIRVIVTIHQVYLMIKYVSEENEKTEAKMKFDILNFAFPFPQKQYNVTDVCAIYVYVTVARISVIYEIC